jgi:hypothetical protein
MKKIIFFALLAALAMPQVTQADLIVGWEDFTGSTGFVPTQNDGGLTAVSVVTTTEHNNWGQWFNAGGQHASQDGTFGDLSTSVASANTSVASGAGLTLNRSNGTIQFTLTNNSGVDRNLEGFYMDNVSKFGGSAKTWQFTVSGAISGAATNGSAIQVNSGLPGATPAQRDKFIDLTLLSDNVWEAGQDAVLTLAFSGATNSGSGGGQELLLDNIAITASAPVAIPEPSGLAMLGLAGMAMFVRRRK